MTGDEGASAEFDRFVSGSSAGLVRLAYLLEGSAADADDLVQDTLLLAFRAWPRVRGADDADRYVSRMMINLHRSRLRRLRLVVAGADLGPVRLRDDLSVVDDRWGLGRALRSLPRGQRLVIVLRYFADESEETVAAMLGCSVGSVKRQAARGREKLQGHPALRSVLDGQLSRGTE